MDACHHSLQQAAVYCFQVAQHRGATIVEFALQVIVEILGVRQPIAREQHITERFFDFDDEIDNHMEGSNCSVKRLPLELIADYSSSFRLRVLEDIRVRAPSRADGVPKIPHCPGAPPQLRIKCHKGTCRGAPPR